MWATPCIVALFLFGYGKVGKGIAKQLAKYTKKLTVIDTSTSACEQAAQDEFLAISANDKGNIHKVVKASYAVITATGIKNIITDWYDTDLFKNKVLINMGVDDEYGDAFSKEEVLNEKRGVNFALRDEIRRH